jgi:lipoprotein-anchoring transpeptidase ErfK/SrfK
MKPVRVTGLRAAIRGGHAQGTPAGRVPMLVVFLIIGVMSALLAGCGSGGDTAQPPPSTTPKKPPKPVAEITTDPADHAMNISPTEPISVNAKNGKIGLVRVVSPEGQQIAGDVSDDGRSWQAKAPLGYNKTYTITASARGYDNRSVTSTSTFNTVAPRTLTFASMNPVENQVVGVGQPIAIYFDEPIANKKAAEDAITVSPSPKVDGAFYWFSDKEVHWRPQQFWAPGTQVDVDFKVYGKDLGNGIYGQEDRKVHYTIGDAFIARADGASHQMSIEINGRIVRTMPIAMGKPDFPSNNGVHVVTDRNAVKVMDSTTFGLALDAGGYVAKVQWATRISNGGEFVHSAPWSVGQQGRANVSHGCINLSPENAKWFFDTVKKGDVVINTNTGGPNLRSWDGFGDWQIPWGEWLAGGAQ